MSLAGAPVGKPADLRRTIIASFEFMEPSPLASAEQFCSSVGCVRPAAMRRTIIASLEFITPSPLVKLPSSH
jgi:hypothetical protein